MDASARAGLQGDALAGAVRQPGLGDLPRPGPARALLASEPRTARPSFAVVERRTAPCWTSPIPAAWRVVRRDGCASWSTQYGVDGFKFDAGDANYYTGAGALLQADPAERSLRGLVRRARTGLPAQRVPGLLEDGRPAAGPAAARQAAHLGRPAATLIPGMHRPRADGLRLHLSGHDRRRRIRIVPQPSASIRSCSCVTRRPAR